VVVAADHAEIGRIVADLVEDAAPAVLGVATGSSPEPAYRELVQRGSLPDHTHLCLVDEYVGLPPAHPQRYRQVIRRELAAPLGIDDELVHAPDVDSADLAGCALQYEALLHGLGGVDLQLLGIGRNGHIGFNEPGTPFDSRTHVATLDHATRCDNARFFDHADAVPHTVVTQGLATIREARSIVLIATGPAKRDALSHLVSGDASPRWPVTALQHHPRLTIVCDELALDPTQQRPTQEDPT
jgi:glucosamine-6-phosphate deaminase